MENLKFDTENWLNGDIEKWWNENEPPMGPGFIIHCLFGEENQHGEKIINDDDFEKISNLQYDAFNKLAELKCQLEAYLYNIRIKNSLDKTAAVLRKISKLKEEIEALGPDILERVYTGEYNASGFDGPSVKKIFELYKHRQNLSDNQIYEFLCLWPDNKELEGRWRLLLIEILQKQINDSKNPVKQTELNNEIKDRIEVFADSGWEKHKKACIELLTGFEKKINVFEPVEKIRPILRDLKNNDTLKDVDVVPTDDTMEDWLDAYRSQYYPDSQKEEKKKKKRSF